MGLFSMHPLRLSENLRLDVPEILLQYSRVQKLGGKRMRYRLDDHGIMHILYTPFKLALSTYINKSHYSDSEASYLSTGSP